MVGFLHLVCIEALCGFHEGSGKDGRGHCAIDGCKRGSSGFGIPLWMDVFSQGKISQMNGYDVASSVVYVCIAVDELLYRTDH